ncbi:MAG: DUF2726 domain-containing protein [Candidatus Paceibacterota bacterium]
MNILPIFIFIGILLGIGLLKDLNWFKKIKTEGISKGPSYKKKYSVMNQSESAFFFELKKQLPEDYYIFPKMRIADILDVPNGHDYYKMRNKILPKHVDFLVCDKYFNPVLALEINGGSHNRPDRIERDTQIEQMFKEANLPLEFIKVGDSFEEAVKETISNLI